MRKLLAFVAVAVALLATACSPTQVSTATTDIGAVATAVQSACTTVNSTAAMIQASPLALIPQVAGVVPYVTAACGTGAAVAAMVSKAAADPTTVSWIEALNTQLQSVVSAVQAPAPTSGGLLSIL